MVEVQWWGDFPEEVRRTVEPILVDVLWFLPRGTQRLYVNWNADGEPNSVISVACRPEYRQASIYIRPAWFNETPAERRRMLLHEFAHIFIEPVVDVANSIASAYVGEDSPNHAFANEQMRIAIEGAVTDLSYAIARRYE